MGDIVNKMFVWEKPGAVKRALGCWAKRGWAGLRERPGQAEPSIYLFIFLSLRLAWFWMGCSSCQQTHPVETCAGIAHSELEGDRPLWKTKAKVDIQTWSFDEFKQGWAQTGNKILHELLKWTWEVWGFFFFFFYKLC